MENATLSNQKLPTTTAHDTTNEPEYRAAADRVAEEIAALSEADTEHVNFDIGSAVTLALGAWMGFEPHLPKVLALPDIDGARILKLRDYTLALHHFQSNTLYATASSSGAATLVEKGIVLRERIVNALTSLADYGVLDAALLAGFGGTTGYRKVAQDLTGLSNLVHERWSDIGGKSMLTLEAMDEAGRLAQAIMQSVGDRERAPTTNAFAVTQRDKAYTLFLRAYDEARRAILYLRWHEGDADTILPSVYTVRTSGKKRVLAASPEATPNAPAPSQAPTAAPAVRSSLIVSDTPSSDV